MIAHCVNHPGVDASGACASCGRPFCDSCLVEFLGQRFCGPCRNMRLAQVQGPQAGVGAPFAGTGTVDIGRWLGAGWQIIQNDLPVFALATVLFLLLATVSCGIVFGPLLCGLFMMAFRRMTYGTVEVSNLFDGFRRFLPAFLATLLIYGGQYLMFMLLEVPVFIVAVVAPRNVTAQLLAMGFYYVTAIPLSVLIHGATLFVYPHIAARNAGVIEAISASWALFRRNILMFTLCGFVFYLIQGAGTFALCFGALITVPLGYAATAQAYADHFGIYGWEMVS